ncbi:proteophosphoglycan ppg3, putative, partial [Leishmania donovani]
MTLQHLLAQRARRTPKRQWHPAVPGLMIVAVTVLGSFVSGATAAPPPIMGGKPAVLIEKVVDCTGRDTIPFYTVEQQANTSAFLAEFPYTIAALSKTWVCRNFCEWDGVHCSAEGVEVRLDSRQLVGRLPEVPTAVDVEQVMVTRFAVEGEGDGIKSQLPKSWRKLEQLKSLELSLDYRSSASKSSEVQNTVRTVRTMTDTASRTELDRCFIPRNAENVSLYSNRMSGTLPPNLPICNPKMKYLYLHNNTGLEGTIPKEWGSWTSLQIINIELTNLCGCPPKEWATFNPSVIVLAEDRITNPDLCKVSCKDSSSSSSPELECDGPIPFYTPTQQAHTRNFLEAFKYTITDLQPLWTCTNFCVWEYVHCTPAGVAVEITGTEFFGSVPEVPAD